MRNRLSDFWWVVIVAILAITPFAMAVLFWGSIAAVVVWVLRAMGVL